MEPPCGTPGTYPGYFGYPVATYLPLLGRRLVPRYLPTYLGRMGWCVLMSCSASEQTLRVCAGCARQWHQRCGDAPDCQGWTSCWLYTSDERQDMAEDAVPAADPAAAAGSLSDSEDSAFDPAAEEEAESEDVEVVDSGEEQETTALPRLFSQQAPAPPALTVKPAATAAAEGRCTSGPAACCNATQLYRHHLPPTRWGVLPPYLPTPLESGYRVVPYPPGRGGGPHALRRTTRRRSP